jgi:hypothetical protein
MEKLIILKQQAFKEEGGKLISTYAYILPNIVCVDKST